MHRVLPDGCVDIVFNLGDTWSGPATANGRAGFRGGAVVGTMTAPLLVQPGRCEEFLGVRFRPGRALAFLRASAHEFTDTWVRLEDVWGREGRALEERLAALPHIAQRVALLEREFLARLRNAAASDPRVDAAVDLILRRGGAVTGLEACRCTGLTRQHLARCFQQYVGIGPKRFCRVVRFQSLLGRLRGRRPVHWAALAADSGYFDQAHLIADFRQFTGLSPQHFLSTRS
jgi:AraC-like DNA-binding protein